MTPEHAEQLAECEASLAYLRTTGLLSRIELDRLEAIIAAMREGLAAPEFAKTTWLQG